MHLSPIGSVAILTTEQLAAIGSVVVESTYCELEVENLIWILAGMKPEEGIHFTHGMQLQSRLDLLSQLAKERLTDEHERAEFTTLISNLKIANSERNVIVHGVWYSEAERRKLIEDGIAVHPPATAFKRRLRSQPLQISANAVSEVAQRIANLTFALSHFWPQAFCDLMIAQQALIRKSLGLPPPLAHMQYQEANSEAPLSPPPPSQA